MSGCSDVGRKRKNNQDSMYFDSVQGLVVVADGIGGKKGGEIASRIAVEGIRSDFLKTDYIRHEEIPVFLTNAVDRVNKDILHYTDQHPDKKGMGTTLNCLMFVSDTLYLAHLGDSRTYLFYKDNLWQLTLDHNVQTFLKRGWLNKDSVGNNPKESALVRSLGIPGGVEPDIYQLKIRPDEIFITCSDGLYGMVPDEAILSIVSKYSTNISGLAKILVAEANKNGGQDNVTVVVSKVCA